MDNTFYKVKVIKAIRYIVAWIIILEILLLIYWFFISSNKAYYRGTFVENIKHKNLVNKFIVE